MRTLRCKSEPPPTTNHQPTANKTLLDFPPSLFPAHFGISALFLHRHFRLTHSSWSHGDQNYGFLCQLALLLRQITVSALWAHIWFLASRTIARVSSTRAFHSSSRICCSPLAFFEKKFFLCLHRTSNPASCTTIKWYHQYHKSSTEHDRSTSCTFSPFSSLCTVSFAIASYFCKESDILKRSSRTSWPAAFGLGKWTRVLLSKCKNICPREDLSNLCLFQMKSFSTHAMPLISDSGHVMLLFMELIWLMDKMP